MAVVRGCTNMLHELKLLPVCVSLGLWLCEIGIYCVCELVQLLWKATLCCETETLSGRLWQRKGRDLRIVYYSLYSLYYSQETKSLSCHISFTLQLVLCNIVKGVILVSSVWFLYSLFLLSTNLLLHFCDAKHYHPHCKKQTCCFNFKKRKKISVWTELVEFKSLKCYFF